MRTMRIVAGTSFFLLLSLLVAGCHGSGHSFGPVPIASAMARAGQETVAAAPAGTFSGVSVRLPADAVPPGTTLNVYSARPVPDGFIPVGQGIRVEVSAALLPGTFATVTLPFDAGRVAAAGATTGDLLVVAIRGGQTDLYPFPRTVTNGGSTVTVHVPEFSELVATVPEGPGSFPPAPPPPSGGSPIVAMAGHGMAIGPEGTVFTFGANGAGQLGNSAAALRTTGAEVDRFAGAVAVAAGQDFSCVLLDDGDLLAFGGNSRGQLGDGTTSDRAVPAVVPGIGFVKKVKASGDGQTVLAETNDGNLYAFGANGHGQVGNGSTDDVLEPDPIPGVTDPKDFAVGDHALAVLFDGTVLAWGRDDRGQLGFQATSDVLKPKVVPALTNVEEVAVGDAFSLALLADGTVMGFGDNTLGQLGPDATADHVTTPIRIRGLTGIVAIAAGRATGVALDGNGRVFTWGAGGYGQLGDGTNPSYRRTPGLVPGLSGVIGIAAGGPTVLVALYDGTFRTFGFGSYGQLGNGATASSALPVAVRGIP